MLRDTDKLNGNAPDQPAPLVTKQMAYMHPPEFEPAAFLIVAVDKGGKAFINMPVDQPHLCLYLATKALDQASQAAVLKMQESMTERSRILSPPPGLSIPPWAGPEGRG